ncbi:MAG: NAD-dependent epimerase/dehydratase family protein [Bacteroidetes bacterium]|nr:NAD-dependent epimerase/dehydratase family protein [Bacteroidota bacterium]
MDPEISLLKNKKVLITGGGGYIGSRLLEFLVNPESTFYVVDISFNMLSKTLGENCPNVKLFILDMTDKQKVDELIGFLEPDYIFHLAALLDRSRNFSNFNLLYKTNVEGTLNLLEALRDMNYCNLFFFSTSEVYGMKNTAPFREDQVTLPLSPYSLTKLMAENLIQTHSAILKKPFTILRLFNLYGKDMPENTFIPQLARAFQRHEKFEMRQGAQKRDYLAVEDVVYYISQLIGNPRSENQIINVCSGISYSLREIAAFFRQLSAETLHISYSLPYRENELWDNRGCNARLLSIIPFHEPVNLFDGLTRTYLV